MFLEILRKIIMYNPRGIITLFLKETWRFLKVSIQTILAPVVTSLLYLLVFASVMKEHPEIYSGVEYTEFLIPGLIMMAILQNAFANSSSSLFQSKQNGSITFILLAPLSSYEFFLAYIASSIVRGLCVGIGVWIVSCFFAVLPVNNIFVIFWFAFIGSGVLGALGLIASIWAIKWDHVAAFQNFVILPLSFLSGVFFSIKSLSPFWTKISFFNPFFYLIDGFRFGFLGVSETFLLLSFVISGLFFLLVSCLCIIMLETGYNLRT